MNRRTFLKATAAVAAASAVGVPAYAIGVEPHWLEIVRRDLPIASLPPALAGRTLAHLSDLHVGVQVSDDYLVHSFERLRALRPDIVVVTGDFITHSAPRGDIQFEQLGGVLGHLPMGALATLGILGNHDYGHDWRSPHVADRVAQVAEGAGIHMLRNDVGTVRGLDIVGIDDLWAARADAGRSLSSRRSDAAIVLCHNPDAADILPWGDYRGWILAGHTHGGQCKAPFLPPPLLPVTNRRYVAGEVQVNEARTLYISRGVGHLVRARFGVRPEITLFTLTRA